MLMRSTPAPFRLFRGDAASLVERDGEVLLGFDAEGRLIASGFGGSVETGADQAPQDPASQPLALFRGDFQPLVQIGDEIIMGIGRDGRVRLQLDAEALNRVAAELPMPGGRPASPDEVLDFDVWNVRRDGEFLYFDAHIWGPVTRTYLRRGSGDPWVNARSEVLLRLLYGDELTDAPVDRNSDHFAHVLSINDGFGQSGLNGAAPENTPTDIQRVDKGFAGLAADSWLRNRRGRPMPWIGVRNEGVMGAGLDELAEGQGFTNLAACREAFATVLAPYGRRPAVDTVSLLIAGIGAADTDADYAAKLLSLIQSITTETGARQVNLFQPPGCAFDGRHASVLGTTRTFVERGALPVIPVSPMYWCARRPGSMLQPDRVSMTMLAELDGLAGPGWLPPLAFAAELDGRDLHIDFEVMDGHKLIAPTRGLLLQSDNGAIIQTAEVTPDPVTGKMTRLSLALSDIPREGVISYAFGNKAPSHDLSGTGWCSDGDLHDDWSMPSVTGQTLRRHAFSFEIRL